MRNPAGSNLISCRVSAIIQMLSFERATTEYHSSQIWDDGFQPDNACGMLREDTGASETALDCRQSEKCKGQFRL